MMPSRARPSRLGVNALCEPRKPMRSARVESNVMRMIFGLPAARREAGRGIEIRKPRRTHRAGHIMKNSLMLGDLVLKPISQSAGRVLTPFDGRIESLPT